MLLSQHHIHFDANNVRVGVGICGLAAVAMMNGLEVQRLCGLLLNWLLASTILKASIIPHAIDGTAVVRDLTVWEVSAVLNSEQ